MVWRYYDELLEWISWAPKHSRLLEAMVDLEKLANKEHNHKII